MICVPIWQNSTNIIALYDSAFDSATDSFVLNLERVENCSRFSVPIDSLAFCKGRVSFMFEMNCSIPPGSYKAVVHNSTQDANAYSLDVKIYGGKTTCFSC